MKARVPISSRTRRQLEQAAKDEIQKLQLEATQRIFKLFCYVLHSDYGFKRRCYDVIGSVRDLIKETDEDPIFWEHLDHVVIDQMGMPFERERVDLDGKLVNKE